MNDGKQFYVYMKTQKMVNLCSDGGNGKCFFFEKTWFLRDLTIKILQSEISLSFMNFDLILFFLFSHSFIHSIIFSIFLSFPEYKFQFLFLFFCIFIISIWIWFELFHPSFLHIMPSYTSRSLLSLPHALLFLLFYIITPNHYYIYWKCFFLLLFYRCYPNPATSQTKPRLRPPTDIYTKS